MNYYPHKGSYKFWSKDEEAFIKEHYKGGQMSAAAIGRELGRTRDEVIGKAHRMGLCTPVRRVA